MLRNDKCKVEIKITNSQNILIVILKNAKLFKLDRLHVD